MFCMIQQMMAIRTVFAAVSLVSILLFIGGIKANSMALTVIGLVLMVGLTFTWVGLASVYIFVWIRAKRRERERQNYLKFS